MRNWPLCQQQLLGSRRRILAGLFLAAVNALELIAERPREKQFLARSLVEATRGHAQPGGGDSPLPTTFLQHCFRLVLFGRQRTSRCRETDSHRRPEAGKGLTATRRVPDSPCPCGLGFKRPLGSCSLLLVLACDSDRNASRNTWGVIIALLFE